MIQGNYIDQVLHARGGAAPYSWSIDGSSTLQCREWGAVHGFMCDGSLDASALDVVAIDTQNNRARRSIPLVSDLMPSAPAGFSPVPAGPFALGYHPSHGRDSVLNVLGQSGFPIDARSAIQRWPAAVVHLDAFCVQTVPVTCRDYLEFVKDSGRANPLPAFGAGAQHLLDHPVADVAYDDARAYCDWLTARAQDAGERWVYRLPTDPEWEKAARGPWSPDSPYNGRLYPWHDKWGEGNAHCGLSRATSTAPVALRGASPCNVGDLVGNVAEWVDGGDISGGELYRHVRGSSWQDDGPFYGLTFVNDVRRVDPEAHFPWLGFRCVAQFETDPPEQALVPLGDDVFVGSDGQQQFIGRYEMARFAVSNEEYRQFAPNHRFSPHERYWPVSDVSHQDALDFCDWKTQQEGRLFSLPSLAHWERACMGGNQRKYPWLTSGADAADKNRTWTAGVLDHHLDENGYSRYLCNSLESGVGHPVDVFALWAGASPEGIYHLCGNVFEWLSDRHAVGGSWLSSCETFGTWPYQDGDRTHDCGPQPGVGFRYMVF